MRPRSLLALLLLAGGLVYAAHFAWVGSAVGAGFAAHLTCSLHFTTGLPVARIRDEYLRHQVWPLDAVLTLDVEERAVVARVLGVERSRAAYRPGIGCTRGVAEGNGTTRLASAAWPGGAAASPPAAVRAAIDRAFAEPAPDGNARRNTLAVVVLREGEWVAERYAEGVDADSPLLSWSMAKSVLAALFGIAEAQGRIARDEPAEVAEWQAPDDPRRHLTHDQLLRMSSSLAFDERYGPTDAASRMLFASPDTAAFAAASPLEDFPGEVWNYSSGTTNLLARALTTRLGGVHALRAWASERLFERIGAHSFRVDTDPAGTPIFSSLAFLTARDWARFGELHRMDGVWQGERILPEGWVDYVTTPTPPSRGEYGAHWWLNRGTAEAPETPPWPELPKDTYAARGYSGQHVIVVPSERLVVVRLGLSSPGLERDGAVALAAELIDHYREAAEVQATRR